MSSCDKCQKRKKTKTTIKIKKMTMMTTRPTRATRSEPALIYFSGWRMKREHFAKVVEEALDSLPREFRSRIQNVAVLVEDVPPNQPSSQAGQQRRLLLGVFHGVPTTKKSMFDLPTGPDHIVLYQKNIEAVCSSEAEVREQIRLTVIHELGHYFGLDEEQLKDV
jgi:predicted Zn-dependent protease with MMP-like domain